MLSWPASLLLTALFGIACRPDAPSRSHVTSTAAPDPDHDAAWVLTLLPTSESFGALVASTPRGPLKVEGSLRASHFDGEVRVAKEFPVPLIRHFEIAVDGRTLFRVLGGGVYIASSFTGALTPLSRPDRELSDLAIAGDMVFACDGEGRLAAARVERAATWSYSTRSCAHLAGLGSELWIIDTSGNLGRTRDGGKTFENIELGGRRAGGFQEGPGLSVRTTDGRFEVRSDGSLVREPDEQPDGAPDEDGRGLSLGSLHDLYPTAFNEAIDQEVMARWGELLDARGAHRLADGTFWSQGRWLGNDRRRVPAPPPGRRCFGAYVKDRTVRQLCEAAETDTSERTVLYELSHSGWVQRAVRPGSLMATGRECAESPDARLVCIGRCGADDPRDERAEKPPDDELTLCVVHEGAEQELQFTLPDDATGWAPDENPETRIIAVDGKRAVVRPPGGPHVLLELDDGRARSLEAMVGLPFAWPVFRQGVLLLPVRARAGLDLVSVGADDEVRRRPAPNGAKAVGFASSRRFVAVGTTASEIWTSVDGGTTWVHETVPIEGDTGDMLLGEQPPLLPCTNAACWFGPVLWVDPDLFASLEYEPFTYVAIPSTDP
jgi:hypothetical protein